jgi:prepilin-type N-terminal cleavage/methylation domain-containing protein
MVKTRRSSAGYTLVEAMLVVAILGILASAGAQMLLQVQRYFILTKTRADVQREARSAMYVITRELRQAQSSSITVDQVANQPFYSRITFNKTQDATKMYFYQNGNKLIQQRGSNVTTLSTHLVYLAFSLPRSDNLAIISVDMTIQEAIFQGQTKALHMASEQVQIMNN